MDNKAVKLPPLSSKNTEALSSSKNNEDVASKRSIGGGNYSPASKHIYRKKMDKIS